VWTVVIAPTVDAAGAFVRNSLFFWADVFPRNVLIKIFDTPRGRALFARTPAGFQAIDAARFIFRVVAGVITPSVDTLFAQEAALIMDI
jgi:hypothetical protein